MNYFVKATNNESGTLTQLLGASETTVAHVTPVPNKAPGFITINIGTADEEEIYYATSDDVAGTISTLTRDTSALHGSSGVEHQNGAPWETAQSATYINQIVDGMAVEHNQTGTHKGALVTTLKATGAEINTGTEDAKIVTPKAIADSNVVITDKAQTITNKAIVQKVTSYTPEAAATATLNLTTGNIHSITMPEGNITIAISNEAAGQCFLVEITQDSGGSRTVTWFETIKWAGGSAPTLTTTGDKRDVFGFRVTGTDTYDGYIVGQNL